MKIDFDKFNLSQKIFSVLGVVIAILVYMRDGSYFNVAIGIVLLTAVAVFLLKYKRIRLISNVVMVLLGVAGIAMMLQLLVPEKIEIQEFPLEAENADSRIIPIDNLIGGGLAIESAETAQSRHKPQEYFTIGSTKNNVKRIQGSPTSIVGQIWMYGYDTVSFDYNDKVSGYSNNSSKLKVK